MSSLRIRFRLGRFEATPQRLGAVAGIATGFLGASGSAKDRRLETAFLASAVGLGVGLVVRLLLAELREMRQEARDLWGLSHAMIDGRPWPAPGGWALGADALLWLLRQVDRDSTQTVVELGPGASTMIMCACRPHLESVGVENDERYLDLLDKQLKLHDIKNHTLLYAPLLAQEHDGSRVTWYDEAVLDALPSRIDLLIVDGPPNWDGGRNRSPAWPKLRDRLGPGSVILVDDAQRRAEREMVDTWLGEGGLTEVHNGGTFSVLTVDGDAWQRL